MNGLYKNRSKLGKWLDENHLTQDWLVYSTKLDRKTVSRLSNINNKNNTRPKATTKHLIYEVIIKINPGVNYNDLW
jgi:hypothetical protein